jgi:hypoxanthine-DNA glycosylase
MQISKNQIKMRGKSIFTQDEMAQIKKLTAEKLRASTDKQKGIRQKIRNIGFYYSDFDSSKDGYTVADIDKLIKSGQIKVIGSNVKKISNNKTITVQEKAKPIVISSISKKSFDPLVGKDTKILILGNLPGDISLNQDEYYAHAGNRFWKIIASITNEPIPTNYEDKKKLLSKHKIGLWDVAHAADRKGSLDINISDVIPNDLEMLLKKFPKIHVIGFNGSKAVKLFEKFFVKKSHIVYHTLSSTSGANTGLTIIESCNDWNRILI